MMTGTICAVAICKSNHQKIKKEGKVKIRFFSFPKDSGIRKQWITLCHRKDKFNPNTSRVCSEHFVKFDFEDIIHAELTNSPPKKLKRTGNILINFIFII